MNHELTTKNSIVIKGARVHNLKNINIEIPKNKLVVITGLSGSGKSSLAFDTIYAESQRRYMESLSPYARQFLELQERPDADEISGLAPAIALDQRGISENPRSTVATVTEIADYLRLLFARVGRPLCPDCKREMKKRSREEIISEVMVLLQKEPLKILAPLARSPVKAGKDLSAGLLKAGFTEVCFNGELMPIANLKEIDLSAITDYCLEVVIGNFSAVDLKDDKEYVRDNIITAIDLGDDCIVLESAGERKRTVFSTELTCSQCGRTIPPLEPRNFSFNNPHGACPVCRGLGVKETVDPELVIPNTRLTLAQGAIKPWIRIITNQSWHYRLLEAVAKLHNFSLDVPVVKLSKKNLEIVFYGSGDDEYLVNNQKVKFTGVVPDLEKRYHETDSDYLRHEIEGYMRFEPCPDCHGKRFNKEALAVTVGDKNIADILSLNIEKAIDFCSAFDKEVSDRFSNPITTGLGSLFSPKDERNIIKPIIKEITSRLRHLDEAGLSYLTLDRSSMSLSGGESERLRLAIQLSTILSGVLYVLDEPTIGLHERDTEKLILLLRQINNFGNSVIVVEHDAAMMRSADWIIDMGPGAGPQGGEVVSAGTFQNIIKDQKSLTGRYLSGKEKIVIQKKRKKAGKKFIEIKGAKANNLKNINVKIPLKSFVCVTGVSGSGKSTLVLDILSRALSRRLYKAKDLPAEHKSINGLEAIDKVISVDQSPIGRTPRSNPATYTGIFTVIRDIFANLPEAKLKGYDAGTFSFNVRGGRCESCAGEGYTHIPMQFMPDTFVECSECHGTRYRSEALEVYYKDKNIADILKMTVSQARDFFSDTALLVEKLAVLEEVGLGYLQLGQPATTLSGGEAQRVKLASELGRRATGKTLYILDEPTTGLHFADVKNLLTVLHQLVEKGNSVLVIEHNMSVIKSADWIVDMGPEGGDKGGYLVAEGTPHDISKIKGSYTGQYLKKAL